MRQRSIVTLWLAAVLALPLAAASETIPARPEQLEFGALSFDVPDGDGFRHTLESGVVVYVAEDHTLPLVNVGITLRGGAFLEPADKVGLSALTATMLRQGGTSGLSAEELDEKIDFLAANISSRAGSTRSNASLNCISPVLDEALGLFFDMLRTPGFQQDRLDVEKDNMLEEMKQRNDDARSIHSREWSWLMFGEGFYSSRRATQAHLDGISRQDLIDFHGRTWRPENMLIAVSGDVDTEAILARLEAQLGKWEGSATEVPWPPPLPTHTPAPGIYHAEKDIPQGRVHIGHLTRQWNDWDDADLPAARVMNFILGGSGFTSRVTQRVRSDEGLAYSAGTRFSFSPHQPGSFYISYQSKSPTVALAAKLALEEVARIREEPVTDEELEMARRSLVETFPRRFESAQQKVGTFAGDAYLGRPHSYWQSWRQRIEKVTAADVQRVAKKYLKPDEMVFLVVGKWEDIAPGDTDQRADMSQLGEVQHLPLRDPLTLEPMP